MKIGENIAKDDIFTLAEIKFITFIISYVMKHF